MKSWFWMLLLASLGVACGKKAATQPAAANATAAGGNPLTAPVDYIGAVGAAKRMADRTTVTISLDKAVQSFYAGEDRYPSNLNELVTSRYLPTLPAPPYGTQFEYDPTTGRVGLRQVPTPPAPAPSTR